MRGEICALFYRFNSVGGFDYVADLLIGATDNRSLGTRPGDSGTLWLIDNCKEKEKTKLPCPLALQWGGQVFLEGNNTKGASSYALATFLSTVCHELDVTILRDWNIGLPDYWGAVGHYSIATKACDVIQNRKLKQLMQANMERISFQVSDINKKTLAGLSKREFVPLADVPDMVWKIGPYKRGGQTAPEHANHFADMDRELNPPLSEGSSLLEICKNKPENVSIEIWQKYYDAVHEQFPEKEEGRGLLPFRAWQIYNAMVAAVRAGDAIKFVCAAGILSHYVGDSCQPLHISYLFNGDPDHKVEGTKRDRQTGKTINAQIPIGAGVHSSYESDMLNRHTAEIMAGVDALLAEGQRLPLIRGGQAAAVAVVELMQKTYEAIPPNKIIDEFIKIQDEKPAARADALWETLGEDTVNAMADGCFCLAQLWDSAWAEGNGNRTMTNLSTIDEEALAALYQDRNFLPSHTLDTIAPILQQEEVVTETEAEVEV